MLTHVDGDKVKLLAAEHMGLALLLCFASGVLTSLTPCIYPMIPITINIFGRAARSQPTERKGLFNFHTFALAGVYVGGMCTTYSLLGVVAGMTGSLFGKLLQSSWMVGFLTVLFFTLALGQFGLFKIALPASMQTKLSQFGNADKPGGIFLMGIFSGLIVGPCVGPILAGILAFVFDTSSALKGFLYFLSFSLGLGVLFLLIGGFSGILAALPRSGAWMNRVNRVLASLMFIAAIYYGIVWARQVGLISHGNSTSTIAWQTDEAAALLLAKQTGKPVLIDFGAEWCGACHEIDAEVFSNPVVQERLKAFIALRLDVTSESPENLKTLQKYGVLSLPAILFLDKNGTLLEKPRINGALSADEFLTVISGL